MTQVGDALPEWVVEAVDPEKMKLMAALLHDPNPIHLGPDAVRAVGLGDRAVNQGPSNLGYVQNVLIAWAGSDDAIRAMAMRFAATVFAGDRAIAGGRVSAVRESDGELLADCEVWLDAFRPGVATAVRALSGTATVVVPG
ncbi:MaoC/PaaZ C-terminal domain-containing protein [Pseudonocardia nigra]|uniref:MaoC/PaaZ C-terminal domain-containing protein n=1 Tax=Pseudonocardia nigra TaxID=1921578 RepID=UPI0027E24019|nr:MaoC/PaaZ C-terminal domain-containing protein [Pseudonocardia nigra]